MKPQQADFSSGKLLPLVAREALQRAACTPVNEGDPMARLKAIDKTIQGLRAKYPQFFRKEDPS